MQTKTKIEASDAASRFLAQGGTQEMLDRLPEGVEWYSASIGECEFDHLRHILHESWSVLSGNTGLPRMSGERVYSEGALLGPAQAAARRIRSIADSFDVARLGTLFAGANDVEQGPYILLDGNHRAAAIALRRNRNPDAPQLSLPVIIAHSRAKKIGTWGESRSG